MEVIEVLRTSILEPHDHLHINHVRALGRSVHVTQITRFGRNAGGQVGGQAVDHISGSVRFALNAGSRTRRQIEDLFAHVAEARLSRLSVRGYHPMSGLSLIVNVAVTAVTWQRLLRLSRGCPWNTRP